MTDVACKNESCGKPVGVLDAKCWWCECTNPGSESVEWAKIHAPRVQKQAPKVDPFVFGGWTSPGSIAPSVGYFPPNAFSSYGMNP
jgi:hypothetical protein